MHALTLGVHPLRPLCLTCRLNSGIGQRILRIGFICVWLLSSRIGTSLSRVGCCLVDGSASGSCRAKFAFTALLCRHSDGNKRAGLKRLEGLHRYALTTLITCIIGQLNKTLDLSILELAFRSIVLNGGIQLLVECFLLYVAG